MPRHCEPIVQIELHGDGSRAVRGGQEEQELTGYGILGRPLQCGQVDHLLRAVPFQAKGVIAAAIGARSGVTEEVQLHSGVRVRRHHGDADAVHQGPEALHRGDLLQYRLVRHPAYHFGEGDQAVIIQIDGMPSHAVILGQPADLLIQQDIEAAALLLRVLRR